LEITVARGGREGASATSRYGVAKPLGAVPLVKLADDPHPLARTSSAKYG
jgi:hypothetical protein